MDWSLVLTQQTQHYAMTFVVILSCFPARFCPLKSLTRFTLYKVFLPVFINGQKLHNIVGKETLFLKQRRIGDFQTYFYPKIFSVQPLPSGHYI